jgi:recombination protein RecA
MGVEHGFVRKSGAWYTYESDQLGQGKENARNFLKENPDLANELEKKIKEKLGVGPKLDADPASPAAPLADTGATASSGAGAPSGAGAGTTGKGAAAKRGTKPPKPGDV